MSTTLTDALRPLLELFEQAALIVERGAIRHVNGPALAMLGGAREGFDGLPLNALLEPGRHFDLAVAAEYAEVEVPWRGGKGLASVASLPDRETYLIVVHRDTRDSLSVRMANFADAAAEGVLIADAVGGINDPLASLLMSLEEAGDLASAMGTPEREELRSVLEEACAAAKRVSSVVSSVLAVPRAPVRTVPVDVNELLERTVRTVSRQRTSAELEVARGMCAPITVARERLEQVLVHVLLTAPAPAGGQRIRVATEQLGEHVSIEIRGGGVVDEQRPAFERRYAVVTSLVQQMGGACEARADAKSVRVRLRFGGTVPRGTELAAARGRRDSAPPRGELRILVVDDEPSIHRALQRTLRDVGMVQAVGSGNAAIELLQGGARFDVVLCDVMMANGTGLDLANWLHGRDDPLKRRMILMTGMGEREGVSHPDILTVAKPFDSASLRELVCQVATRA